MPSSALRHQDGVRAADTHLTIARGSAHEVVAAVDVAEARRLVASEDAAIVRGLCDRVLAMLWRMSR